MRRVWAKISEEEIISTDFVQGKKNSFLVFYTPVPEATRIMWDLPLGEFIIKHKAMFSTLKLNSGSLLLFLSAKTITIKL